MKKRTIKLAHLVLTIERNDSGFLARCPTIEGAFAEGETVAEAIFNCVDVVRMILDYRKERGERIPEGMLEEMPANREISFSIPIEV